MTILQIIPAEAESLGAIPIHRVLPSSQRQMVGPFIFMDQGGPSEMPKNPDGGVAEHPHAGLSTFTYLLAGRGYHRDSAGFEAPIGAGDIALMTAGSGITHEERGDPDNPDPIEHVYFVQMWLALPDELEEMDPAFELHKQASLPLVRREGGTARVLMGTGWGATAPSTAYVETIFADITVDPGGRFPIEVTSEERGLYLLEGTATINGEDLPPHALCLIAPGGTPEITTRPGCRVILLGGAPFPTPRYVAGSFVASSQEKLLQLNTRYRTGDFPSIAG